MNQTLKTIAERYSCRKFSDKKISEADLASIANAGIQAPSARNQQNWFLSVVGDKALLDEIEAEGMRVLSAQEDKSTFERIMERGGKLFYNAQAVIFISVKDSDIAEYKKYTNIDLGIIAQNISLAATALGIDNCHCGLAAYSFASEKAAEFKAKLKVPEGFYCYYGVLFGYGVSQCEPHIPDIKKVAYVTDEVYELKTLEDYISYWKSQSITMLQTICKTYGVEFNKTDTRATLVKKLAAGMENWCKGNKGGGE